MRRLFAYFLVLLTLVASSVFSQVTSKESKTIIAQLKETYPDKVIYIDVWATWCGPCINQFRYAETLKKDAQRM